MQTFAAKINEIIDAGWNVGSEGPYKNWSNRVVAFLSSAIDDTAAAKFKELGMTQFFDDWNQCRERQIGHLEGLTLRIEAAGLGGGDS